MNQLTKLINKTSDLVKKIIHHIDRFAFTLQRKISFFRFKHYLHPINFEKHCLINAMTWSGKSELIKYLVQLFYDSRANSIILIDPHGDVADELIQHKNIKQEDLVYFSVELFKQGIFGINPFAVNNLSHEDSEILSSELSLVFEEMIKGGSALTVNMKSLLVPCIGVLLRRKESTIQDLIRFMDDERNGDLIALGMQSHNPSHVKFFESTFHNPLYSITKQSISAKIQSLLNSYYFTQITSVTKPIDLKRLINSRKLIIFNLSKGRLGSEVSRVLWRFIIAQSQSIAISRSKIDMKFRVPTYLFIDEWQNYTTQSIKHILEEARKYRLYLILSSQLLGRGIDPILKETILTNTNVKIIGTNSYSQQAMFAKETGIEKSELMRLRVGEFYMLSKFSYPRLYRASKLFIGGSHNISYTLLQSLIQYQLNHYYKTKPNRHKNRVSPNQPQYLLTPYNDTQTQITKDP